MVLDKTLKSPLDCKEIQPVHSEDQPWDFFGRNDAKAETPVLWPPHATSWLIGKDSDAGRDWGQEEKGTTEDEMAGWHHWLDGHESEWTLGVGDGQGGLACCDSWGRRESDTTEWLTWSDLICAIVFVGQLLLWFLLYPFQALPLMGKIWTLSGYTDLIAEVKEHWLKLAGFLKDFAGYRFALHFPWHRTDDMPLESVSGEILWTTN